MTTVNTILLWSSLLDFLWLNGAVYRVNFDRFDIRARLVQRFIIIVNKRLNILVNAKPHRNPATLNTRRTIIIIYCSYTQQCTYRSYVRCKCLKILSVCTTCYGVNNRQPVTRYRNDSGILIAKNAQDRTAVLRADFISL